MLCFNETADFWHGELRPGVVHTSTGILDLLGACFAKLPPSAKVVIIRADKGFYDHKTVEYREDRKALFAVSAKITRPIKTKLTALSYKKHSFGTEVSGFMYQPKGWPNILRLL